MFSPIPVNVCTYVIISPLIMSGSRRIYKFRVQYVLTRDISHMVLAFSVPNTLCKLPHVSYLLNIWHVTAWGSRFGFQLVLVFSVQFLI